MCVLPSKINYENKLHTLNLTPFKRGRWRPTIPFVGTEMETSLTDRKISLCIALTPAYPRPNFRFIFAEVEGKYNKI